MIEPRLQRALIELDRLHRSARLSWWLAGVWITASLSVVGLWLVGALQGDAIRPVVLGVLAAVVVLSIGLRLWLKRRPANYRRLACELEQAHPSVRPLLTTAVEQQPDPEHGDWTFLQERLIRQVLAHPDRAKWRRTLRQRRNWALGAHTVAVLLFVVVCLAARQPEIASTRPWLAATTLVEPGDVELERGSSVVISIRFDADPPREATLVLNPVGGGEPRRIPLERHLEDPLFGTSLREVMEDATYHIEYRSDRTRDYAIRVFEYPALRQADASLTFPAYTGLTNRVIPDTLRITAVEGAQLDYVFQLNKPVKEARLIGNGKTISLRNGTGLDAHLEQFTLRESGRYALQLVDDAGRTNRRVDELVLKVVPNRPPELKLSFPRGDQRVSALQELQLQAETMDDFGVLRYGVGYGVAGEEPRWVELGQDAGREERRTFSQLIDIEQLGLNVDQVISYFLWADDYDPDGNLRRTYSDMFFAEVRPFEEIFRADTSSGGEEGSQGASGGGGGGNEATRLTELQKQIVIATWKMQREKASPVPHSKP